MSFHRLNHLHIELKLRHVLGTSFAPKGDGKNNHLEIESDIIEGWC